MTPEDLILELVSNDIIFGTYHNGVTNRSQIIIDCSYAMKRKHDYDDTPVKLIKENLLKILRDGVSEVILP